MARKNKRQPVEPATKPLHLSLNLPPEYKEPFKRFAGSNDRNVKAQAIHVLKHAVDQWMREHNSVAADLTAPRG